jgi:antitoxin (DNA-binding transcriptional repressor) of toxin-antitoxin stability system
MSTITPLKQSRIITMRELAQNTSAVIAEITEAGETAFLTKRGQFIAAIVPLEPGEVERKVLAGLVHHLQEEEPPGVIGSDSLAAQLGINVESLHDPKPPRRA